MAGRGDFDEVVPIINDRLFMLRNGRWQILSEPVNPDRSVVYPFMGNLKIHSGISLATSFADSFSNEFGEFVGMIPCADGGSSLSDWEEGGLLFDHAVMQTELALRTSELCGILWHQGESDSKRIEDVESYCHKLVVFFSALRKCIGKENVPIIIGELGDISKYNGGEMKYFREINAEIHKASELIVNSIVVSSEGLTNRNDNLHFDSESLRKFGIRYFEAYKKLMNSH